MKTSVILLQDVTNIGRKYDVKSLASGYVSNFLIPKRLAEVATPQKLAQLEVQKKRHTEEEKIQSDLLEKSFESIKDITVELSAKANEQGHLFQGIHAEDIAVALKEKTGINIPVDAISLDEPIKRIGDLDINIKVGEKETSFNLSIVEEK